MGLIERIKVNNNGKNYQIKTRPAVCKGFTLSEVLIALVIIGIVAALTVPNIITHIREKQYKTAYRKAYRDINLAFADASAHNLFPDKNGCYDAGFANFTWTTMKNKFNTIKLCENNNAFDCWVNADTVLGDTPYRSSYAFIDASGRQWIEFSRNRSIYFVDTNGDKKPNKFGKDRWHFTFTNQYLTNPYDCSIDSGQPVVVRPYFIRDYTTTDDWCKYPPCYYKSWLTDN